MSEPLERVTVTPFSEEPSRKAVRITPDACASKEPREYVPLVVDTLVVPTNTPSAIRRATDPADEVATPSLV